MTEQRHLWELDHPYYCSEDNYLGPSRRWSDYTATSWSGFDGVDWDPELNLVFRWEWKCGERERAENVEGGLDDPAPYWGDGDLLVLFVMLQRKGHFRVVKVHVTKGDEPEVREFLSRQKSAIDALWAGI